MNSPGVIQKKKALSVVFFPIIFSFIVLTGFSSGFFPVTQADSRCESGVNQGIIYSGSTECAVNCGALCVSVSGNNTRSSGGSSFTPQYPTSRLPEGGNAPITSVGQTLDVVVNILNFAQAVFWILAAGFGLYGAYLYLFSQGSKESVTQAKNMMVYTVVAVVVAIISYGIPAIVNNFVAISTS